MGKTRTSLAAISGAIFITLVLIFYIGESMRDADKNLGRKVIQDQQASFDMLQESEVFRNPHITPLSDLKTVGSGRSLETFYSRRAYLGAPPVIPHKVGTSLVNENNCLTCHKDGGYVKEWSAYAPITPHPSFLNCRQCHVTQITRKLFVGNNWQSVRPPQLGRSALPGSPPPIPHSLQLRGSCLSCHAGAGSVAAIRVDHPDRTNCRQCHVPARAVGEFSR